MIFVSRINISQNIKFFLWKIAQIFVRTFLCDPSSILFLVFETFLSLWLPLKYFPIRSNKFFGIPNLRFKKTGFWKVTQKKINLIPKLWFFLVSRLSECYRYEKSSVFRLLDRFVASIFHFKIIVSVFQIFPPSNIKTFGNIYIFF